MQRGFSTSRGLLLGVLLAASTLAGDMRLASQTQQPAHADPHAAIRANNLGAAYMNQQRMEQALAEFERAAALDPQFTAARLNQGIALLNLQRVEPARAVLREVAERDPKNIRAWYNLGLLEKNAGEAEAALLAFEKAAALDPADADTHYFIGTLHAQQNRFPQAIAAFQQAIARNRFHVSAEFGLARALQRTGDAEKARAHLARFQHLNTEKLGAPLSLAYGDQGPYSLTESVTLPPAVAQPPIPVKFVLTEAAASAGPRPVRGQPVTAEVLGDYDNDGLVDRAVIVGEELVLLRNEGAVENDVTEAAGIRRDRVRGNLLFFDFDHDGDLDLYVTGSLIWVGEGDRDSPDEDSIRENTLVQNVLWRNNGNGTFTDWSEETGLEGPRLAFLAIATDFDNDRAIDLVLAGPLPPSPEKRPASLGPEGPTFLHNEREGPFQATRTMDREFETTEVTALLAIDLNRDGWMDLAFAHRRPPGITVWPGRSGKENVQPQPIAVPNIGRATHLVAMDFDNDGWLDLAALTEEAGQARLVLLRNEGGESFREVTREAGMGSLELGKARWLAAADVDEDGDADLLIGQQGGPAVLLRNDGGNTNHWLKLSLKGLADNKSAMGTKVEVFAGASYQKFEVTTPNDLLIGLGAEKQADVVRLLWPTGVLQDEVNLAANQRHVITQIDRRGSSCPVLFAWNGTRFEFIADAIGPGIVGHWVAPGVRNTSDPTEYIKVPGTLLRERRGPNGERLLSFRFAEPMEEIVYLDQLRLFAIDHPADSDVNPSERFYASGPPFPTGEPVFTHRAHARPPAQVWNHRGADVTALLRDRDRRYVSDFADAPYKGFAELHWIELELGDAPETVEAQKERPLRLLLHGFTDYFTATSVYAAHQGGVRAIVPYVEAQLADGAWRRVVDDMGFPAGLARTMVADLTGKLPPGTRRIRIASNLKIYWDQILIDTTPQGTPHRITEAPMASARAGYLGYPREIRGTPESDVRYDYHSVSATGPYARAAGHYTRYGDVRALVAQADDRFVLLGSGDEVAVDFDATALPPVPAGWTRNWFFYVDGFAKDMDFYAAHPFTTTPLPYHAMPGYPYPAEQPYPDRGAHLQDQLELHTRAVSGRAAPSYRYAYPP